VHIGSLIVDPPVVNGSGAIDIASADPDWSVPETLVTKLGAYVTKSVTLEPRRGHPQPWAELIADGTMLNAVGLANVGVESALEQWSDLPSRLGIPVIVSLAGSAASDFASLAARFTEASWVSAFELNLSCPNVRGGLISSDPRAAGEVVTAVRAVTELPLIAKLSPACGDVAAVVRSLEAAGVDAFTCCNTMPARWSDPAGEPVLGAGFHGGMSGAGLHPLALRTVAEVAAVTDLPVVGLGGVDGIAAARRMFGAGASVIGVGTAAVIDPGVIDELVRLAS
jgi:dihydroorotate dehydrogenase (NAD+) catalytic subunit